MSAPVFPQEIFDAIIDRVADLSLSTLKDVSLTSWCFVHRSQSCLFWKVILPSLNRHNTSAVERLQELQLCPAILAHVRALQVSFDYSTVTKAEEGDVISEGEKFNMAVSEVVEHLPAQSLKHVFVTFSKDWKDNGDRVVAWWDVISPTCKATLHILRFNHSLDIMSFYNIGKIPISFLIARPPLKHVEFEKHSNIATDSGVMPLHSDASVPCGLQGLSCRRTGIRTFLQLLPYLSDLSHLALEITDLPSHRATWATIATSNLPGLKSLTIHYSIRIARPFCNHQMVSSASREMDGSRYGLPSFPRLRYLQILLNAGRDNSDVKCRFAMPSFIPQFLVAMIYKHPQSSLEILDFATQWDMERITSPDVPGTDASPPLIDRNRGWKEVDDILSSRELFPKLHVVRAVCVPQIHGMGWLYAEPSPNQTVPLQVQQEAAAALHQTRNIVAIVDTGSDETVAMLAEELVDSILPERYIPTGRYQKAVRRF